MSKNFKIKTGIMAVIILFVSISAYGARLFNGQHVGILSTSQTTSAAIVTGQGIFHGFFVNTDGTNGLTISFYDNTTGSAGTYPLPTNIFIAGSARAWAMSIEPAAYFSTGVYAVVTSAGTYNYTVVYDQ